jgi:hypothetical protein
LGIYHSDITEAAMLLFRPLLLKYLTYNAKEIELSIDALVKSLTWVLTPLSDNVKPKA